jgi:hypothetical protein
MLLVGQEIALTFDFCSTATLTLAKGEFPLWIPRHKLANNLVRIKLFFIGLIEDLRQ